MYNLDALYFRRYKITMCNCRLFTLVTLYQVGNMYVTDSACYMCNSSCLIHESNYNL